MPSKRHRDPSQTGVHTGKAEPRNFDRCQTPAYAIGPLLPFLPNGSRIWECACGEGFLANALHQAGHHVLGTDILPWSELSAEAGAWPFGVEYEFNFLCSSQPGDFAAIVTNPPYSNKLAFMRRCYDLKVPFALLMPVEFLSTKHAQRLFEKHGVEIILLDKRINFKMPNKAWGGKGAHFGVAWFTWGLGIGSTLTYGKVIVPEIGQEVMDLEDAA